MSEKRSDYHRAVEKGRGTLWLLWLIPLVAMMMAGWLIYKHYADKGTEIVVTFNSGKGIEAGKTPLIYQGIKIGTVTDIRIDAHDLYKVDATIVVDPRASQYITREGTKFIKVEPKVSVTEISGLDTILTGVYIEVYPAGGTKEEILKQPLRFTFEGMNHYPPRRFEKGLYLTLESPDGSLSVNAPVLYNGFIVGRIVDKTLHGRRIDYTLFIEDRYRDLVDAESRFWKLSGIEVRASLAGVKVAFDSLATLLAGGIAFESPESDLSEPPKKRYRLYDTKLDTHLDERLVTIVADKAYNIDPEFSSIMYKGFRVGKIVDMHYDTEKSQTVFTVRIAEKFIHLANEKAWFWIVRPVVSIRELKGLDAVLSGPYIAFDTADIHAPRTDRFVLHDEPIPLKGKHIRLKAAHAESLKSGMAIFFKDIPIGEITKINLVPGGKTLDIDAVIFDKFTKFLNDSSMFYVKSGFEMEVSLHEIHIDSGSLETMVVGGISMVTLNKDAPKKKRDFFLYRDYKTFKKARYLASGGSFYHIETKELGSLSQGSPVLYRKLKAGEIISYKYLPKRDSIDILIFIEKNFKNLINASTRFENLSGVELEMNFPDIKLKMASMETLIHGGLVFETPDPEAAKVKNGHRFRLFDENFRKKERYTAFELWMDEAHGIKKGTRLFYKDFPIGKVDGIVLERDMIKVDVLVEKSYARLLRSDSKIWLKTFQMDLEGVRNVDNALTGPALVVTPGLSKERSASFTLSSAPPPPTYGKTGLRIVLHANRRSSLDIGSPLYYRQVPIGKVESWALGDDATHVEITVFVEPRYIHLVREHAKFYMAGAFGMEVNLMGVKIKTETLKTMVAGGIGMAVPENPGNVVRDGHIFPLFDEAEEIWTTWKPKL
ncbi:MlaD family protein [Hydrogenimonas sp.]